METTSQPRPTALAAALRARIEALNQMIQAGRLLEAHDKYYAEDCIQQENEDPPTVGKAANRRREAEWLGEVTAFRNAVVKSVAVDAAGGVTMVEWFFDYSHRTWGDRTFHQVAVQHWKDGLIQRERFYYGR